MKKMVLVILLAVLASPAIAHPFLADELIFITLQPESLRLDIIVRLMGPPALLIKAMTDENRDRYISTEEHRSRWKEFGTSLAESVSIMIAGRRVFSPTIHFEYALGESECKIDDTLMGFRLIMIIPWSKGARESPFLSKIAVTPWEVPILTDSIKSCPVIIKAVSGIEASDPETGQKTTFPVTAQFGPGSAGGLEYIQYQLCVKGPVSPVEKDNKIGEEKEFGLEYRLVLEPAEGEKDIDP